MYMVFSGVTDKMIFALVFRSLNSLSSGVSIIDSLFNFAVYQDSVSKASSDSGTLGVFEYDGSILDVSNYYNLVYFISLLV